MFISTGHQDRRHGGGSLSGKVAPPAVQKFGYILEERTGTKINTTFNASSPPAPLGELTTPPKTLWHLTPFDLFALLENFLRVPSSNIKSHMPQ